MNNILENGTQVLLFNQNEYDTNNLLNFIKVIIIDYDINNQLYIVKDQNNNIYKALYGNCINGFFIRTIKDHLNQVKITILNNKQIISNLNHYNLKLYNLEQSLQEDLKTDKIIKRS